MLFNKKIIQILIAGLSLVITYFTLLSPHKKQPTTKTYYVTIVAAHNEKVKDTILPYLKKKCKKELGANLHIEWVKHGNQVKNYKIVNAKFIGNNEKTSGYDIFWGGPAYLFYLLSKEKRLAPLNLDENTKKNIPSQIAGIPIYTPRYATTCLSTFGMIYNKKLFKQLKLKLPTDWEDLGSTELLNKLVTVDPCQSINMFIIYHQILETYTWEKGWRILARIAANSTVFLDKSSSASSSIAQGMGLIAPTNDFYAQGTIHTHGEEKLGFILPKNQILITRDFIAALKGNHNKKITQLCINWILNTYAQCLMMHKENTTYGPQHTIGRIAINQQAYEIGEKKHIASAINPFDKATQQQIIILNQQKINTQYPVTSALFKAYYITPHKQLQKAWELLIKNDCPPQDTKYLTKPPLTQSELKKVIKSWKDPLKKQKIITQWTNQAIKRYQYIIRKYT